MDEQALTTILLRDTSLTREGLDMALQIQSREGTSLAEILRRDNALPEEELARAQAMLRRAARLDIQPAIGQDVGPVLEMAMEAIEEKTPGNRDVFLGNLLLVLVALASRMGIDAEGTLRDANARFERQV